VDEALLSEALALALVGWGKEYLDDPNGLWSVIGYYAALTARTEAPDASSWISEDAAQRIASILRPGEDSLPEPAWLDDGESAGKEARGGVPGIAFPGYDDMLSSTLGVWRALSAEKNPDAQTDGNYIVTVEDHLDEGVRTCLVYTAFEDSMMGESTVRGMPYLFITDFHWTEGGPSADPGEEELPPVDWEHLREANGVETLLFRYGGFKFTETSYYADDPVVSDLYYWVGDPGILSVSAFIYAGGAGEPDDTYYSFWDGEQLISATVTGRGILASGFFSPDPGEYPENAYPLDDRFIYDFYAADHQIMDETEDTVTFLAAPDILDGDYYICTADRKTLAVLDYMMYRADGTLLMERHTEYGRDKVEDFMAPAIGNIRDLRSVKYNIKYYGNEGEKAYTLFFHLPRAWEFSLEAYFDGELFFYADEGLTVPAENLIEPGDEDLVFWATNAAG
jgi:hypothetical protein